MYSCFAWVCVHKHHVSVWCPLNSEESFRSSGTGIRAMSGWWVLGAAPGSSARAVKVLLKAEPSLQPSLPV